MSEEQVELDLCGWRDHEGYVWKDKEDAKDYFAGRRYTLRPVYSVGIEEEFNGH